MRSILAVSDLTHASDGALRCAARIAGATDATLHVLHASGIIGLPIREAVPLLETLSRAQVEEALERQLRRVPRPATVPVERHLVDHGLSEAVRDRARSAGAELVVMGAGPPPHGRHPLAATAGVPWPVLVARGDGPRYERVVIPVGPEELEAGTLHHASRWVRRLAADARTRTELHVLHTCARLADWREIAAPLEAGIRALESAWSEPGDAVVGHVRWCRDAAPQVVATARDERADLIVLPPGRDDAEILRLAVEQTRCSVLLLPPADGVEPDDDGDDEPLRTGTWGFPQAERRGERQCLLR